MLKSLLIADVSLACLSMGYCLVCVIAALTYLRRSHVLATPANFPPLSILKPLKGTDPEMYESLRSHCIQDYPEYEILFGVSDPADPAADVVRQLQQEFPAHCIQLVHCEKNLGANGKVSSLAQLTALAKHEVLLVNDSDIRVRTDYVRTITTELQQTGIGLVTCLYRGVPANTLGSKLECLGISTDFVPGVLTASLLERGIHFGLGSTLMLRKPALGKIGGFEALANYLADDYELGRRIADTGAKVGLSRTVVATFLPAYDFSGFLTHQLRWLRTIRASRPAGYAGLPLTFTLPWAFLVVGLAGGSPWSWTLFAIAASVRFISAIIIAGLVLRDRHSVRMLWLLPLRDLLAPFIWAAGLFGKQIVWRGEIFELNDGKLIARESIHSQQN